MSTQPSGVIRHDTHALTKRITACLRDFRIDTFPASVVELSKHCLLDWLGVTLAGSREPAASIVRREAQVQSGVGPCHIVGTADRLGPFWAALVNGTASHALDFDDVVKAMAGHPTVPIVPALLALSDCDPNATG